MNQIYYIRGTITIKVDCVKGEKSKATVGVVPCVGFLTPDKPQKAIAFPVTETETETEAETETDTKTKNDSDQIGTALLIGLNERKACEFGAKAIKDCMPALLSIAGQQKPVELRLSREGDGNLRIVGFVYSAP